MFSRILKASRGVFASRKPWVVTTSHEPLDGFQTPTRPCQKGREICFVDHNYRHTHVSAQFGRTHGSAPTASKTRHEPLASFKNPRPGLPQGGFVPLQAAKRRRPVNYKLQSTSHEPSSYHHHHVPSTTYPYGEITRVASRRLQAASSTCTTAIRPSGSAPFSSDPKARVCWPAKKKTVGTCPTV